MRLIDADKIDFSEVFFGENELTYDSIQSADMLIYTQPTAYDVDKVVRELDEYITKLVGRKSGLYQTVIGIVKAGGIND